MNENKDRWPVLFCRGPGLHTSSATVSRIKGGFEQQQQRIKRKHFTAEAQPLHVSTRAACSLQEAERHNTTLSPDSKPNAATYSDVQSLVRETHFDTGYLMSLSPHMFDVSGEGLFSISMS